MRKNNTSKTLNFTLNVLNVQDNIYFPTYRDLQTGKVAKLESKKTKLLVYS